MAGAKIEIQLDDAYLKDALAQAAQTLDPDGLRPTLEDIGEYLLLATRERAAGEVSAEGLPWTALSPRYALRKAKRKPGLPMLVYDKHLLGDQLAYQVDGDILYVGTSAVYGATHQFGDPSRNIPARPWLGTGPDDDLGILQILHDHLAAAFIAGAGNPATP